jgi:ceramide glucosyltransferase
MVHKLLELVFFLGTLGGLGYYFLCLWSALSFRRSDRKFHRGAREFAPPVSILKPLKGADHEIYSSFRSHCLQNYGEYEIVFGVSDPEDEAVPLVRRLMAEFPQHKIRLVVCPEVLGTNRKVSNLIQMLPHTRYDYVLVNDSDIRVAPNYLKRVLAHFTDQKVGLVTTVYRGVAATTLSSALESTGIATEFAAGVLAARQVEGGIHFALGSTLAMRRSALEKIGGFQSIVDYLADDFELGQRIDAAGYEVILCGEVVDTFLPAYKLKYFFEHQLRWARSTRDSRKLGYAGVGLTFGLPWAILLALLSRGAAWSWWLLVAALLVRFAMAIVVGYGVLQDRAVLRQLWLVPIRDAIALLIWIWSYAGNTIMWRGDRFVLKDGKIYPTHSTVEAESTFAVSHDAGGSLSS